MLCGDVNTLFYLQEQANTSNTGSGSEAVAAITVSQSVTGAEKNNDAIQNEKGNDTENNQKEAAEEGSSRTPPSKQGGMNFVVNVHL